MVMENGGDCVSGKMYYISMVRSLLEVNVEIWNGRSLLKMFLNWRKSKFVALNWFWKINTKHIMKLWHSLNLIDWVHDANPFVSHSLKKPWDTTLNFTPFRNYTQHASGKNVQLSYPNIRKDIMSLVARSTCVDYIIITYNLFFRNL